MEIKPVKNDSVAVWINALNKILPQNNPSIFMQQDEETKIPEKFVFDQLYK